MGGDSSGAGDSGGAVSGSGIGGDRPGAGIGRGSGRGPGRGGGPAPSGPSASEAADAASSKAAGEGVGDIGRGSDKQAATLLPETPPAQIININPAVPGTAGTTGLSTSAATDRKRKQSGTALTLGLADRAIKTLLGQ